MQKAGANRGPWPTMAALRLFKLRAGSRPPLRDLAEEAKANHDRLFAAELKYQDARDERIAWTAEVEYRDGLLDADMMQVGRELRALVGGNTDDPRYALTFTVAPSAGMTPRGGSKQGRFVANVIFRLETEASLEPLRHLAEPLKQKQQALAEAEGIRQEKWAAEDRARADRRVVLLEVQSEYNQFYPRVQLAFPGDEALVESMFYKFDQADADADDGAPPG